MNYRKFVGLSVDELARLSWGPLKGLLWYQTHPSMHPLRPGLRFIDPYRAARCLQLPLSSTRQAPLNPHRAAAKTSMTSIMSSNPRGRPSACPRIPLQSPQSAHNPLFWPWNHPRGCPSRLPPSFGSRKYHGLLVNSVLSRRYLFCEKALNRALFRPLYCPATQEALPGG